jgi:DNA-directed RNA polymerase subunit RPC12/RpoP
MTPSTREVAIIRYRIRLWFRLTSTVMITSGILLSLYPVFKEIAEWLLLSSRLEFRPAFSRHVPGLIIGNILIGSGIVLALCSARLVKLFCPIPRRSCIECGYDLRSINATVCPECGTKIPWTDRTADESNKERT